ncbi:uncharacterized protein LOC141631124 [Silene latifolia]|uniref:uncharacterized protein LOC141631124 n=1 Tax=Silene latifolia TaxID=37657 RepID=UPI003D76AD35
MFGVPKSKGEHKRPQGKVQSLDVPEWKWESISMDIIVGFPRTQMGNNMIRVIVDRLTKSAHFISMKDTWSKAELAKAYVKFVVNLHGVPKDIVSDRDLRKCRSPVCWDDKTDAMMLWPEMIQEMVEHVQVIRQKMRSAQDRQKSYADLKRSDIEFAVGKNLRKYVSDPAHILEPEHMEIDEQMSYVEVPKEILDRKVRKTKNGETLLVMVLWTHHNVQEATLEAEASTQEKYPDLFVD